MKKSFYVDAPPPRRPLKIFAFDPMLGRSASKRISIDIVNEPDLKTGPHGSRLEVIDYDGTNDCYYAPVDLNEASLLMQGGLDPNESDPRFHQQMVYAVTMKVLENFEQALGRRIFFRYNQRLRQVNIGSSHFVRSGKMHLKSVATQSGVSYPTNATGQTNGSTLGIRQPSPCDKLVTRLQAKRT